MVTDLSSPVSAGALIVRVFWVAAASTAIVNVSVSVCAPATVVASDLTAAEKVRVLLPSAVKVATVSPTAIASSPVMV